MNKRAQISMFIILGIVILAAIGIVIFLKGEFLKSYLQQQLSKTSSIPPQLQVVKEHIDDCLKTTGKESIYYITQHGGYYNVPKETSIVYFTEEIPYYYLNKKIYIPSIDIMERELTNYIFDNLKECLDFNYFIQTGFNITAKNYSVSTKIMDKSVYIKINFPIKIEKSGISGSLKEFELNINSNIKTLNKASKEIVNSYSQKPGFICLTCLEEISKNNNAILNSFPGEISIYNKEIIWILIIDKEYSLNNINTTLRFVLEK